MNKHLMFCEVVRLPIITNFSEKLHDNFHGLVKRKVDIKNLFLIVKGSYNPSAWEPQQLYLTTNDEIKEGDWYICYGRELHRIDKHGEEIMIRANEKSETTYTKTHFKVVASTAPIGLPLIPESFLIEYVKTNGTINTVKIEMEYNSGWAEKLVVQHNEPSLLHSRPKMTNNGEVIIHYPKDDEGQTGIVVVARKPEIKGGELVSKGGYFSSTPFEISSADTEKTKIVYSLPQVSKMLKTAYLLAQMGRKLELPSFFEDYKEMWEDNSIDDSQINPTLVKEDMILFAKWIDGLASIKKSAYNYDYQLLYELWEKQKHK